MRLIIATFLSLFIAIGAMNAQVTPEKSLKNAGKAIGKYFIDTQANGDKLSEARLAIDAALESETIQGDAKAWLKKGEIYNAIINKDAIAMTLKQEGFKVENESAGLEAFAAFKMALKTAAKKYQTKEALKGLQETANSLANIGNYFIETKDLGTAYGILNAIVDIRDIHKENGMKTLLDTDKELNDHKFIVGYCAMKSDRKAEAKKIFTDLIAADYDEARIYAFGFELTEKDDEAAALAILEKGKAKYSTNSELMFAEINYYIKKGDFASLKSKLEAAIKNDPENASLYSALGNVYMNLFQEEYAAGNIEKANNYFTDSKSYFEKALALNPDMFDVNYNIGSLYYNKAVEITKKMNDLPINETKKYDSFKVEMEGLFNQALPFFKKAESLNSNDRSTLIALKEIFARLNDFEKSAEFKKRFETVKAGGTIEKSYF